MLNFKKHILLLTIIFRLLYVVSSTTYEIPEEIYELCPYTDICNKTATKRLEVKGLEPCCKSCGCDKECGLRLDCCFDYLDSYRLIENDKVACVRPFTGDEFVHGKKRDYYNMVKSCDSKHRNSSLYKKWKKFCPANAVNGTLQLEPVSSVTMSTIYINAACAYCNNVDNFTKWNFIFVSALRTGVGTFAWNIALNEKTAMGTNVYIPPRDEDWSKNRCYTSINDKCAENMDLNRRSTLEQKCEHMNVFYRSHINPTVTYKNIFCYKCSRLKPNIQLECLDTTARSPNSKVLTVLLDPSLLNSKKWQTTIKESINVHYDDQCPSGYVLSHSKRFCLPVSCPNGMLETPSGCKYFILRWYSSAFYIQIKLVACQGNKITASDLMSTDSIARTHPFLWIKYQCQRLQSAGIFVYYQTNATRYADFFIVQLWIRPEEDGGIDISVILPKLRKCLNSNWRLIIQDKSFDYYASLDTHFNGAAHLKDNPTFQTSVRGDDNVSNLAHYTLISHGPQAVTMSFMGNYVTTKSAAVIKKTFFCKQVQVPVDEVEERGTDILILGNNVTLGNNEYMINNYGAPNINQTISICLDDYEISQRACAGGAAIAELLIVVAAVFSLKCCVKTL